MTIETSTGAATLVRKLSGPVRLIGVAILALLLLIPLQMVRSVVQERFQTYRGVVSDIAGAWSGDQRLAGPILVVPYTVKSEVFDEYVTPQGEKKFAKRWEKKEHRALILPTLLKIDGTLTPEERRRGIYRVQVYNADLEVTAAFREVGRFIASLVGDGTLDEIHWSQAVVAVGLSEPRGIVDVDGLAIGDRTIAALPGTTISSVLPRGFHAAVGEAEFTDLDVHLPLKIRGSGGFSFLPLGATTRATLGSPWPHPSFFGDVLPVAHDITADGFTGEWTIPLLNRSYPQAWPDYQQVNLEEIAAGVRLFEPVALYDLVTRAVKYGLLFVVLTFLTLGLIEFVKGTRLSLVQYLLIGVALALFFLILIALAEHIGFALAYVVASATVILINTLYCAAILPGRGLALAVGTVLTAIYGILYIILKAEDYALLGGTVLLVVALVVTMYFTRNLNEVSGEG